MSTEQVPLNMEHSFERRIDPKQFVRSNNDEIVFSHGPSQHEDIRSSIHNPTVDMSR